ncbi:heavy metal translocating P-type ATPase [Campylobacter insulaenigrae]|uniref:heavy metal translocating P-type ATPase n=1 Tax=Campylobacter insulaenigrae TaxID=260714 RepID=UPI002152B8BA|nr:heavy metal translocating P-type ATPase [Campylobacter insulaenigrae]MCR6572947.1 heavy metal translocating P-type ATPase [Campylobacter insulaenigrae]MCR6574207.1 heavy metal translocating P-type ATPase [Campylobacter insulaenigrae]MCR6580551.1 heavy metal translocating P-type ATPase [Campylobacter insulaenigrae]MCR6581979.1 heavy metal translocating P-type ATPase [Campylobacter insulaenigrae]MCR6586678.1 heavy metal translocating P-type ATPase [Campylobacter insulaenigrae]
MKCKHCQLNFKQEQMIEKNGNYFCCNGCQSVYEILHDSGLEEFYDKLGNQTLNPVEFKYEYKDYQKYITKTKDGLSEIFLLIEDIHCAACVWLNEKILIKSDGVVEVDINSITHKVRIVFDENIISLVKIIQNIECIGYKANIYSPTKFEKRAMQTKREFYAKLIVAVACVMNIMWISVAKYAGFFSGMEKETKDILHFAEFLLCTPVIFYTGSIFYKNAYYALKFKNVNMDTLVISGASLAYIYSVWAMFSRSAQVYFDSVAMIICFVFVGKYLELLSKKRALDALDHLRSFLSTQIRVLKDDKFQNCDVENVNIGDIIEVKEGDRILIDGVCISGNASLDISSLSGESLPKDVCKDDEIYSASLVLSGSILYECKTLYKDSKLAKIISLLENSSAKKAKIEKIVGQISKYFSPIILSFALVCFLYTFFILNIGFEEAMVRMVSVLIIACPCALALATPVSSLVAISTALKEKILFKEAGVVEDLSKCNIAVFDKTGVLTKAKLEVINSFYDDKLNKNELINFLYLTNHPVAKSILDFLKNDNYQRIEFEKVQNIQAKGYKAYFNQDEFIGGNEKFLQENNIKVQPFNCTHFIFAKNGNILATFELENNIRNDAKELIKFLKEQNLQIYMLTGDNEFAAKKVASILDIQQFQHSCMPEDKLKYILDMNLKNKVLMVGDGVNDTLALSHAAVGVALKEGSALALENSDIILLKNDLQSLKKSMVIAKKTYKIIKQNLAFSLCYNACTIPLAFLGLINPLIAALSMSFSSLVVILNALRIKNE